MKKPLPHEETLIRQFAIEGLIKGYANSELIALLVKDYPNVELSEIESLIRSAHLRISEATLVDLDKIIPLHIEIYERIYKEMDDLYYVPGKLKAMRQKEKIVGLHKETNKVDIYNEINVEVETDPVYDISKLDIEEQKKLNALIKRVMNDPGQRT